MVKRTDDFARHHGIYPYAVAAWAGLILVLSLVPGVAGDLNSGYLSHVCAYFVLTLMLVLSMRNGHRTWICVQALFYAGLFGLFIECLQYFIPYRAFEITDIAVNVSAAVAAAVLGHHMIRRQLI
jgi:glycopeptide antibiotics resistance protein